jgi:uncharacterized protein (DUF2141 family)
MTTPDTLRLFPLAALLVLGTPQPGRTETATAIATLEVTVTGIKSAKGVIRLALCPPQAGFPDCKTRIVRSAALPIANGSAHIVLSGLAPGNYALSVFHDANANGKLDTFMGIPKEGYGFSRNPGFKPRAPTFAEAEIDVAGSASAAISLRYIF